MSDRQTTVAELRGLVREFVERRDWRQFHAPKNLAMSLAIEAAELMEHFQWISPEDSRRIGESPEQLAQVADELADVLCYALAMSNELDIDLSAAIRQKMTKNEQKYPADQFYGRAK
jgi:NTP pyrophosphatase (non-canonical NTP hydrolase)